MLCFGALLVPGQGRAAQVVITITGTVAADAIDFSGIFGPAGGSLIGDPFTLVLTVDDTQVVQSTLNCPIGDAIYGTIINSTPGSNPGTATLTIGTGSFTFGLNSPVALTVSVDVPQPLLGCFNFSEYSFNLLDGTPSVGSQIIGNIVGASGTFLTTNPDWEAPFSNANLVNFNPDSGYLIVFQIYEIDQSAIGILYPQSISVSGPITTSPTTASSGKTLGDCEPCKGNHPGLVSTGLPITIGTGNMFETATDYTTTGQTLSASRGPTTACRTPPILALLPPPWELIGDPHTTATFR